MLFEFISYISFGTLLFSIFAIYINMVVGLHVVTTM